MTKDAEFLTAAIVPFSIVLVSRVRQSRPIRERVSIWERAVRELVSGTRTERLFELGDDGQLFPWEHVQG